MIIGNRLYGKHPIVDNKDDSTLQFNNISIELLTRSSIKKFAIINQSCSSNTAIQGTVSNYEAAALLMMAADIKRDSLSRLTMLWPC